MQHIEQQMETGAAGKVRTAGENRKRVESVVETLATLSSHGESLAEVAHDARNMVTALGLYCDLLEEPGVLAAPYAHYGNELRLVAAASRRLVEKLVAMDTHASDDAPMPSWFNLESGRWPLPTPLLPEPLATELAPELHRNAVYNPGQHLNQRFDRNQRWDLLPALPVANLAAELLANRNLLSAMAGPAIALTVDTEGGAQPVRLTGEDLTRVLINLVKNAAEAMPAGGRVHISLCERDAGKGAAACVALAVEDNGSGIPAEGLERIFLSGFTTHRKRNTTERGTGDLANGGWPVSHRGLGLAITRSIVEAAGGRIFATNREQGGVRFEIELPVQRTGF